MYYNVLAAGFFRPEKHERVKRMEKEMTSPVFLIFRGIRNEEIRSYSTNFDV